MHDVLTRCIGGFALVMLGLAPAVVPASQASGKTHAKPARRDALLAQQPRVSLSPRYVPGETYRYEMEFETTTNTSRTGLAADPQGPTQLVVTWNATVRLDVLPASASTPDGIRLRTTYEKSSAILRSDTFDPQAIAAQEQYRKLEGKVVEFTLNARGSVTSVSGLEGIVDGDKALQTARDWIGQLAAGAGAPVGGVSVGQKWASEQPASSLSISGLFWRTQSEYLRDEICRPPDAQKAPGASAEIEKQGTAESCAVILSRLELVQPKVLRDPTPQEYLKNGVHTTGKWNGSAQSLSYISLRTGMAVSVTQTGAEQMDVTLTNEHHDALRYWGTIASRSQVALAAR